MILIALPVGWFFLRISGILRPPRPMFHDRFVQPDHDIFPFWRIVPPAGDKLATLMWMDPVSNIVVVLFRTPPQDPSLPIISKGDRMEATQSVFDIGSAQPLTILASDRDTLVVVSPTGAVYRNRCLTPGAADRLRLASRKMASAEDTIAQILEESLDVPPEARVAIRNLRSPSP